MVKAIRYLLVCVAAFGLTACGQAPTPGSHDVDPGGDPISQERSLVPQLGSQSIDEADKALAQAGLIGLLRYEPAVVEGDGKVIGTDPSAGTLVSPGSVITMIIAGQPRNTLDDYVAAHRETFVGIGVDSNGVIVIGIHEKASLANEMSKLSGLAKGKVFRVQSCSRSWVDLQRVQLELARRQFVKGADKLAFTMTVDPSACAVRMIAEMSDADVAALTTKYSGALVIQKGSAVRGG